MRLLYLVIKYFLYAMALIKKEEVSDSIEVKSRFFLVKVDGPSMYPTLADGAIVLADSKAKFRAGDIVVAKRPGHDYLVIKRVGYIEESDNTVFLCGDNLFFSADSRHYGRVHLSDVLGKVVA